MSALGPGWAEKLGKQLEGDSDVDQRMRARGGRPFKQNGWGTRCESTLRGARKAIGRGGVHPIDKVLGKVDDDAEE